MNTSHIYQKEEFWFVEFLDTDRRADVTATGVFTKKEDAENAAKTWENDQIMDNLGQSIGRKG